MPRYTVKKMLFFKKIIGMHLITTAGYIVAGVYRYTGDLLASPGDEARDLLALKALTRDLLALKEPHSLPSQSTC